MAPNAPAWSFIHISMAGSRSTAPLNRSNSVLIVALPFLRPTVHTALYTRRPLARRAPEERRGISSVMARRLVIQFYRLSAAAPGLVPASRLESVTAPGPFCRVTPDCSLCRWVRDSLSFPDIAPRKLPLGSRFRPHFQSGSGPFTKFENNSKPLSLLSLTSHPLLDHNRFSGPA